MDDARRMLKDLTARCQGKPLFVSDELPHYGTVLGELFHEMVPSTPTGKPGRPRNPQRVIDEDLSYATVHKTRQSGRVIKVERKVVHGSEQQILARLKESPSKTVNTAYIERSNLDWRLWDAHLARKTPTVAPFNSLAEGKVRHLCRLLQFNPAPRNSQSRRGSSFSAQDPGYGCKHSGS